MRKIVLIIAAAAAFATFGPTIEASARVAGHAGVVRTGHVAGHGVVGHGAVGYGRRVAWRTGFVRGYGVRYARAWHRYGVRYARPFGVRYARVWHGYGGVRYVRPYGVRYARVWHGWSRWCR
jgi:hypothetical protein